MLDLNTLISKSTFLPEMTRFRASMRREERDAASEGCGLRQTINPLGSSLRGRPNHRTNRPEKKTDRHITFRLLRHNKDVIGCKNFLVAGNAEGYRTERKRL